MTADEPSNPDDEKSSARGPDGETNRYNRALQDGIVALLAKGDGWATRETIAYELERTESEVADSINRLSKRGEVQVVDLGRVILVVLPHRNPKAAVAELFDSREEEEKAVLRRLRGREVWFDE